MRKAFIIFFALCVIAIAGAPAIDGFLFKNHFQSYLNSITKKIPANAGIHIELSSYKMGWTKSTAKLLVSVNDKNNSSPTNLRYNFEIDIVISHGPLVSVDGNWKLAYANANYRMQIPYIDNTFLRANTLFSLFNNKVTTTYTLDKINIPQFLLSDGFKGEMITSDNGKNIFINTLNLGEIKSTTANTSMKFIISPMQFYDEILIDQNNKITTGKSNTISDGFVIELGPSIHFSMKKILFDSATGINNFQYQYKSTLHIDQLILPLSENIEMKNFFIENTLNDFKIMQTPKLNNNITFTEFIKESVNPSSTIESKTTFDTALGPTNISIVVNDLEPYSAASDDSKNAFMGLKKYRIAVNVNIPMQLAGVILTDGFKLRSQITNVMMLLASKNQPPGSVAGPSFSPEQQSIPSAKNILSQLVNNGFLIQKDNRYSLSLLVTEDKIILNDISITSANELKMSLAAIMLNASQNIPTSKPASIPTVVTTPTTEAIPAPATTVQLPAAAAAPAPAPSYGCYWQQTTGGKYFWILIKELPTKDACFKMDSCSGGQGASRGGCFKWATSPDATPQPW